MYLITGSLYILITFVQSPPPAPHLSLGLLNQDLCGWSFEIGLFTKHISHLLLLYPKTWNPQKPFMWWWFGVIENWNSATRKRGHFSVNLFHLTFESERTAEAWKADLEWAWGLDSHMNRRASDAEITRVSSLIWGCLGLCKSPVFRDSVCLINREIKIFPVLW